MQRGHGFATIGCFSNLRFEYEIKPVMLEGKDRGLLVELGRPVNRPVISRPFGPVERQLFELYRRTPIGGTMSTFRVVEEFDVIKCIPPCFFKTVVDLSPNALPFEKLEETLSRGIVVTVSASTHIACSLDT